MATASIVINGTDPGLAKTHLPIDTEVNLANINDTGISSYEWVIVSQPGGGQDNWSDSGTNVSIVPAPDFTPTKEGSYLIKLTVNKNLPDEASGTTICAVRELQTGNRIPAPQETTEVSQEEGWATQAVTEILQRVTRLQDSGIFVAQNDSGGDLSLGKVVHMNGMTTIGTGTNERPIPTVGLALANDVALVDGPLGVVVGNRDGDPYTVSDGDLCRVMVMGGISSYDLGVTAAEGAPVFVDDLGDLSLTAGTVIRQVGDVAKDYGTTVFDIAISAGANSIPRGNAGGDLEGSYPDPTVARINGTSVALSAGKPVGSVLRLTGVMTAESEWGPVNLADSTGQLVEGTLPTVRGGTGSSLSAMTPRGIVFALSATSMGTTATAGLSGQPLLSQGASNPVFGALALNGSNSVTGTLPVDKGGTGQNSSLSSGGLIFANSTASMTSLTPPVTSGSVLLSPAGGTPYWSAKLPLASGGTNADLSGVGGVNGVLIKASSTTIGVIAAGSTGALLTPSVAGVPTWTDAGSAGQMLQNNGGLAIPTWVNFSTYFDAQYAGSSTATDALFSTTGAGYQEIVSVTRSCKRGMVQVTPMPIADGAAFINYITTAATNTYSTVSLKFVVTFPDASIQNYLYQFRSSTAHNNNQNTGSITFPSFTFYTSQEGDHTVSMQVQMSINDTFTANATALRISQG